MIFTVLEGFQNLKHCVPSCFAQIFQISKIIQQIKIYQKTMSTEDVNIANVHSDYQQVTNALGSKDQEVPFGTTQADELSEKVRFI